MSMDNNPQMKPQDTVIYLLGELKGEMGAIRGQLSSAAQAQALVNAENKTEHEEFRKTLEAHASDITTILATRVTKTPIPQVIGAIGTIISIVTAIGVAAIFFSTN